MTLLPWVLRLDRAYKCHMIGTAGLDVCFKGRRVADDARLEAHDRIHLLAILDGLADVKDGKRLGNCEVNRTVSKHTARTYAAPETKREVARIRFGITAFMA